MSKIEWTDLTWNPISGCSQVSPGCKNCYAKGLSRRMKGRFGYPVDKPFRPTFHTDKLAVPFGIKKAKKIFVGSMGDLFHDNFTNEHIAAVFGVLAACPQHTFQILTKRPDRAKEFFDWALDECTHSPSTLCRGIAEETICKGSTKKEILIRKSLVEECDDWPLTNVWLGVTVENQDMVENRFPSFLQIPAAIKFISCEPLLGPIDLSDHLVRFECFRCGTRELSDHRKCPKCGSDLLGNKHFSPGVDWVIVGGENGNSARPMHPDWARAIRYQCSSANVPFFFKQWGKYAPVDGNFSCPGDLIHYEEVDTKPESMTTDKDRQVIKDEIDGKTHKEFPIVNWR